MKLTVAAGFGLLVCAVPVCAQQTLVGKYTGNFMQTTNQGERAVGITLDITSVEDGKVKGTAVRMAGTGIGGRACAGTYEMEGTHKGDNIDIRTLAKGGHAEDCNMRLRLVADGNKLKGKFGSRDVELSK